MREYAIEKGHHGQICSEAMQLKETVEEGEKDLMFNPNDYKSRYQVSSRFEMMQLVGLDMCTG